jgi:cobalt/nickel transport protein
MILALLFALVGFINSHAGQSIGTDDKAVQVISSLTGGSYQPWASPVWQPSSEVQGLLFCLQAAIGLAMIAYFLRSNKSRDSPLDGDWR